MFEVPLDAPNPLVVVTFLATARAAAGAKFRVKIDSSVEFELYAGIVDVLPRGANAEPAKITLRKGIPYRVPVDIWGAMVLSCCGSVAVKPVGG
jgi:ferric-dicitrate binding protein FerR (iron transport regulator)